MFDVAGRGAGRIFFWLAPRAGALSRWAASRRVGVRLCISSPNCPKGLREIPYGFCGRRGWRHAHVLACGLSGHGRPLAFAGGVTTAACGISELAENFFKKVLDRNRRSVNIVDAPFAGN